jgi:prophage regulatory protein
MDARPHRQGKGANEMKLLRLPEVAELVRLGKSTIYERVKDKRFPAPIKQGGGNFWIDTEIEDYLQKLMAKRPGQVALNTE